jgi:NADH-quinone oxidoreductase subunit L
MALVSLLLLLYLLASIFFGVLYFRKVSPSLVKVAVYLFSGVFLALNLYVFFCKIGFSANVNISIAQLNVPLALGTSTFGRLLQVVVGIVGPLVLVFSSQYMASDTAIAKYFAFLSLFLMAMTALCFVNNLLLFYVFWELVGLSSYLLIGFWYQKPAAFKAAKKAFLINRIGDAAFATGIILFWLAYRDFNFVEQGMRVSTLAGLLLFGGTVAKSAQFPLQTWLPDAMEGPTPVSALIHAATMVAAGIYLLVRVFPYLNEATLAIIAGLGAFSMLYGGVVACFQGDIKRQLAFSTMSQLGLMVLAVGLGSPAAAMLHLTTHAFFKAGLFLVAGVLIHQLHTQQISEMKTAKNWLFVCHVILACSLAGVPFFSGYLSKESIVAAAYQRPVYLGLILLNSLITAYYISKQWRHIYGGIEKGPKANLSYALPLGILTLLSVGFVYAANGVHGLYDGVLGVFTLKDQQIPLGISVLAGLVPILGMGLAFGRSNLANTQVANQFGQNQAQDRLIKWVLFRASGALDGVDKTILGLITAVKTLHFWVSDVLDWLDANIVDGLVNKLAAGVSWAGKRVWVVQDGLSIPLRLAIGIISLFLLFYLL